MKNILLVSILFLVTACGTSSQDAVISIFPKVNPSNIGDSIPLHVSVVDSRSSKVIGTYGVNDQNPTSEDIESTIEDSRATNTARRFGGGSQIYTNQDLARTIGVALVDSFSRVGFSITDKNSASAIHLHVFLEELNYTMDPGTIKTEVNTKSRVRVEAVDKG